MGLRAWLKVVADELRVRLVCFVERAERLASAERWQT
jgi:hypothetical protein